MPVARPLAVASVLPSAVGALRLVGEVLSRIVLAIVTTAQDGMLMDPAVSDVLSVSLFILKGHPDLLSRHCVQRWPLQ